tara:strand:+ start:318 stop:899 length:582 start_codon:yes stop_codon:yes gene_type:complete
VKPTTKEKILLNTLKLIEKNPFPKISTKQIAKETGISEGAIFKHFNNKEDLLQHLCDKFLIIVTTIDLSEIRNETDFRNILINFFQNLQKTQNQVYKLVLYVSMYKQSQFKIFNKIINKEVYEKIENVVKNNLKNWNYSEKINIKIHVRLLMYSLYFFTIQQRVFGADKIENFDMKNVIETSVDNFLMGLKKR